MIATPVNKAPEKYSQREEARFRRQVELYLEILSSNISSISALTGNLASLASKRENFTSPPIG